jgi:hypothetical protein
MIHDVCSLTIRAITLDPFREGKKTGIAWKQTGDMNEYGFGV